MWVPAPGTWEDGAGGGDVLGTAAGGELEGGERPQANRSRCRLKARGEGLGRGRRRGPARSRTAGPELSPTELALRRADGADCGADGSEVGRKGDRAATGGAVAGGRVQACGLQAGQAGHAAPVSPDARARDLRLRRPPSPADSGTVAGRRAVSGVAGQVSAPSALEGRAPVCRGRARRLARVTALSQRPCLRERPGPSGRGTGAEGAERSVAGPCPCEADRRPSGDKQRP